MSPDVVDRFEEIASGIPLDEGVVGYSETMRAIAELLPPDACERIHALADAWLVSEGLLDEEEKDL